tara:strand:+ start:666 stop:1439 length:774 start_codon:yes stop_codon:yes gene_type:complete
MIRRNSLDPIKIANWEWKIFLDEVIKSLAAFDFFEYPIENQFLVNEKPFRYKDRNIKAIAKTWASRTNKLSKIRAACIHVDHVTSVLNLVINPSCKYDLPFFGADFVRLPTGYLLALDLQPVLKDDLNHTKHVWDKLIPIHKHWQDMVPSGGPIPKDALQFFSPAFFWTRLPICPKSDRVIKNTIFPAFKAYLDLYLELVSEASLVTSERSNVLSNGQKDYLRFRAKKDPARGMLIRFFGQEWTDSYLKDCLFELVD